MATTLYGDTIASDVWMHGLRDGDAEVWSRPVRSRRLDAAYTSKLGGTGLPFPDNALTGPRSGHGGLGGSSRDSSPRLKRSNSVKVAGAVEAEGDLRAVGLCQKPTALRTQEDIRFIQSYMCQLSYFFSLWPAPLQWELARLMSAHILARREVALTRGRPPDRLYFVVQGRLDVRLPVPVAGGGREERTLAVLTRGHTVGEAVLLGAAAQHTTVVVSSSSAMLLSLARPDFSRAFKEVLDIRQAERLMYLRLHPQMAGLELGDLETASEVLGLAFFPPGTRLWPLDEKERCLYFLAEGQAKVKRGGGPPPAAAQHDADGAAVASPSMYDRYTISILGPGDIFGLPSSEAALAVQLQQSQAHAATATTATTNAAGAGGPDTRTTTTAQLQAQTAGGADGGSGAVQPAAASTVAAAAAGGSSGAAALTAAAGGVSSAPGGGGPGSVAASGALSAAAAASSGGPAPPPSSVGVAGGSPNIVIEAYSQVKVYTVRYSDYLKLPASVQQVLQAANAFRWSYYEGRMLGLTRMDHRRRDARLRRHQTKTHQRRGGGGDGGPHSVAAAAALQQAERDRVMLGRVPLLSASAAVGGAGGGPGGAGGGEHTSQTRRAAAAALMAQREHARLKRWREGGGDDGGGGGGGGDSAGGGGGPDTASDPDGDMEAAAGSRMSDQGLPSWAHSGAGRGPGCWTCSGVGGGLGGTPRGTESGVLPLEVVLREAGGGRGLKGGGPLLGKLGGGAGGLRPGSADTVASGQGGGGGSANGSVNGGAVAAASTRGLQSLLHRSANGKALLAVQAAQLGRVLDTEARMYGSGRRLTGRRTAPSSSGGGNGSGAEYGEGEGEYDGDESENDTAPWALGYEYSSSGECPSSGGTSPPRRPPHHLPGHLSPPRLQPATAQFLSCRAEPPPPRSTRPPPPTLSLLPPTSNAFPRVETYRRRAPPAAAAPSTPAPHPTTLQPLRAPPTPPAANTPHRTLVRPQQSLLSLPAPPRVGGLRAALPSGAEVVETEEPRSQVVAQSVRQRHVLMFQNAQAMVAAASHSRPWVKPARQPRPSYGRVTRTGPHDSGSASDGGTTSDPTRRSSTRVSPAVLPLPLPLFGAGGSLPLSAGSSMSSGRRGLRPDDRLSRYGASGRASSAGGTGPHHHTSPGAVGTGGGTSLSLSGGGPQGVSASGSGGVGGLGHTGLGSPEFVIPKPGFGRGPGGSSVSVPVSGLGGDGGGLGVVPVGPEVSGLELSFAHLGVREVDDDEDSGSGASGGSAGGEAGGPEGAGKGEAGGAGRAGGEGRGATVREDLDDAALLARVPAVLLGGRDGGKARCGRGGSGEGGGGSPPSPPSPARGGPAPAAPSQAAPGPHHHHHHPSPGSEGGQQHQAVSQQPQRQQQGVRKAGAGGAPAAGGAVSGGAPGSPHSGGGGPGAGAEGGGLNTTMRRRGGAAAGGGGAAGSGAVGGAGAPSTPTATPLAAAPAGPLPHPGAAPAAGGAHRALNSSATGRSGVDSEFPQDLDEKTLHLHHRQAAGTSAAHPHPHPLHPHHPPSGPLPTHSRTPAAPSATATTSSFSGLRGASQQVASPSPAPQSPPYPDMGSQPQQQQGGPPSGPSQPVGLPPAIALGYESLDPFAWAALAAQVGPGIRTPFSQENILPKPQW